MSNALQRGNIVSGTICFPNLSSGPFRVKVYQVGDDWNLALLDDAGRGDGVFTGKLPGNAGGTVVVSGEIDLHGYPNPTVLNGQVGTLTINYYSGATETLDIRVFKRGTSFNLKKDENFHVTLTCQIIDQPDLAGFGGSQAVSSDDSFTDKDLWGKMRKTLDPAAVPLADNTIHRLRVVGTADTDSAEVALLQAHFSDTAPETGLNLRLRPVGFQRATARVVYLDFRWMLNDTNDDATNPDFNVVNDPNLLETQSTVSLLSSDGTGDPTAPVLGDAGVLQVHEITKLNPQAYKTKDVFGLLDTKEKRTFPETHLSLGPIAMEDEGGEAQIYDPTQGVVPPIVIVSVNSSGQITSPIIVFPSGNLPSDIAAVVSGGGGSSGALTLTRGTVNTVTNALSNCTVGAAGSGYTSAPTITFTGTNLLKPATVGTSSTTYPSNLKVTMGMPVKINRQRSQLTWKFATEDAIDRYQLGSIYRPHTFTSTNQSNIGSSGERALIDCIPPSTITDANSNTLVMTHLITHPVVTDKNRATLRVLYRALYAMTTSAGEIQFRGSSANGSLALPPIPTYSGGIRHDNIEVIVQGGYTSADTNNSIETTMDAALIDDLYVEDWSARKINDVVAVQTTRRKNNDKMVVYGECSLHNVFSGADSTGAYCLVLNYLTRDSSTTELLLGGYNIQYARRNVVLYRRYKTLSAAYTALNDAYVGYTHASTDTGVTPHNSFLGQLNIMFKGGSLINNWSHEGTNHTYVVKFNFTSQNLPFIYPRIKPGTRIVTGATISATGSFLITSLDTNLVTDLTNSANFTSLFLS